MTIYSEARENFSRLLGWHLRHGTRPSGHRRAGCEWGHKEFGAAVRTGITDKTVQNWISGRHLPRCPDHIESALFGDVLNDQQIQWRDDLRAAHNYEYQRVKNAKNIPKIQITGELSGASRPMLDLIGQVESIVNYLSSDQFGNINVIGILDQWPSFKHRGSYPDWSQFPYVPHPTGNDIDDEKVLIDRKFKPPKKFNAGRNETIGLVCGIHPADYSFDLYPIKYRTKLALIENNLPHATVSAGAVVLGIRGDVLLLHMRSAIKNIVHEARGQTHSFLGSARMPSDDPSYIADRSADECASRECFEETGSNVEMYGGKIAIVKWSQNQRDGDQVRQHSGVDVVYLGGRVTNMRALKTEDSYSKERPESDKWEGYVRPLELVEEAIFEEFTSRTKWWFPPGIAHHLLWLGLGAPGASEEFVVRSAAIYDRIIEFYRNQGAFQTV